MKHRTLNILSAIAFFAMFITGCDEAATNINDLRPSLTGLYLWVEPAEFYFTSEAETESGTIYTESQWDVTEIPSWLSMSPEKGTSRSDFTITVLKNETTTSREAIIKISSISNEADISRNVTIEQRASDPYIGFEGIETKYGNGYLNLASKQQSVEIQINTNITDLEPYVSGYCSEWVLASYNADSKTLNITLLANESNEARSGEITLKSDSFTTHALLKINQYASGMSVANGISMEFEEHGGSQTQIIESDIPWSATCSTPWIEFTPKSGEGGKTSVTVTALPSYENKQRYGTISFYAGTHAKGYISITQKGRYINVTPSDISLKADQNSSGKITIESNIGWEITNSPEWLSTSMEKGNSGQNVVTITAQENNSLQSRSGKITIKDTATGGLKNEVNVTQEGMEIDKTPLNFGWHQSSMPYTVQTIDKWTADISDTWISLSSYNGNGGDEISVSVARNDREDTRKGNIMLTSEGKTFKIDVIQEGQYLKLTSTSGEFSAQGGETELFVTSSINTEASVEYASSDENWVSYSKIDNTYKLTIASNPSTKERRSTFVLTPMDDDISVIYAQGVKYSIKQAGRTLGCSVSTINMFASQGISETYHVTADGKYSITKDPGDTWYDLVPDIKGNTFYIVVSKNTTDADRIGHITLSLLDLPSGESLTRTIEVLQHKSGYHFSITFDNYNKDEQW